MNFVSLFRRGPYTAFPHRFQPLPHPTLLNATWQVVAGTTGQPAAQLFFSFRDAPPSVANPDMTLALLLDNSGSMGSDYSNGHVYNLASMLLNRCRQAGVGYDLVFYNSHPSFAGHVDSDADLHRALDRNPPGGATAIVEALRGTVTRYRKQKGIYIIVITDGEFSDKTQAMQLVTREFLPQLTPTNPYAFRMHFVGAGAEVDREFLEQLERAGSSQGIPMVSGHHHAHISHAHTSIASLLDMSFLGAGHSVEFRRKDVPDAESHHIARVGQSQLQSFQTGEDDTFAFLPRQSTWVVDVAPTSAKSLQLEMRYDDGHHVKPIVLDLTVPLSIPAVRPSGWRFGWPSATDPARKQTQKEALEAAQARECEDLKALAKGGIPVQARQRLKELQNDPNALFTANLDPSEAALLRRAGYRPVATVGGSAMYHVGQAFASLQDCEVPVLSQAYDEATRLAVNRMKKELAALGAHGVVGVRFEIARREWSEKTIEVMVVGTAVQGPGPAPAEPWLCDLSGHEWWALYRAGYEPCDLVWGHCSWFVFTDYGDEMMLTNYTNGELQHWSHALSRARTIALDRARTMAPPDRAHGLVGVRIERRLDKVRLGDVEGSDAGKREHHNLLVSILGTAVRVRPDAPRAVPATAHVLSLRDGSLSQAQLLEREVDAKFE